MALQKIRSALPTLILIILLLSFTQLIIFDYEKSDFINDINNIDSATQTYKKHDNYQQIRNYFTEIYKGNTTHLSKNEALKNLSSIKVITTYIKQHSQEQLQKEYLECNNTTCQSKHKFVVGLYSCPDESGNRLHIFMNSLLVAIATNRTLLWRYSTLEAVQEYNITRFRVTSATNVNECDQVLDRAPWIPSFHEWNEKFRLEMAKCAEDAYDDDAQVIHLGFSCLHNPGHILTSQDSIYLTNPNNRKRIQELNALNNVYFIYGLLFETLFTIRDWIFPKNNNHYNYNLEESYFLHARHNVKAMDGSYIWHELLCLRKVLGDIKTSYSNKSSCNVYLLSDREKTIELLTPIIHNMSCVPIVANHTTASSWISSEHGPWAGIGFWQDLALAINARTGFIAFHAIPRPFVRTSTGLILQLVEFRRVIEFLDGGVFDERNVSIPNLKRCENPHKPWGVSV